MVALSDLAKKLIEVVPPLMHQIRAEIRAVARESLTVPQYRILSNIQRGICHVGQIADYQGVSQPAMSKMVEGLVARGWVYRDSHATDRRQIVLRLTPQGTRLFETVKRKARVRLVNRLQGLTRKDRDRLALALLQIESVFQKRPRS